MAGAAERSPSLHWIFRLGKVGTPPHHGTESGLTKHAARTKEAASWLRPSPAGLGCREFLDPKASPEGIVLPKRDHELALGPAALT